MRMSITSDGSESVLTASEIENDSDPHPVSENAPAGECGAALGGYDATPEQVTHIARLEAYKFQALIDRYATNPRGIRLGECKQYLAVWQSVLEKQGIALTKRELSEVQDALDSGDYDSFLLREEWWKRHG